MSTFLREEKRLTTTFNFSKLPPIPAWNLYAIIPANHSDQAPSVASSNQSETNRNIDREEPCFVTKSADFAHDRAHWVNAVRDAPELKAQIEFFLVNELKIVQERFSLDQRPNLANLDRSLHAWLDRYSFFAITGSLETLKRIMELLQTDNDARQGFFDQTYQDKGRTINLLDPVFMHPKYELVALHPKHMLPDRKKLSLYNRDQNGQVVSVTDYVPGVDNTLREQPGTIDCSRFPQFSFDYPNRPRYGNPNPFLVILNAEIKFRRYSRQAQTLTLPPDVMQLIQLTTELVKLIYFKPVLREGTEAVAIMSGLGGSLPRGIRSTSGPSDMEMGYVGDENKDEASTARPRRGGHGVKRPAVDATLTERMDYWQYMLSGRDLDFNFDDEKFLENLSDEDYQTQVNHTHVEGVEVWRNAIQV